MWQRLTLLLLLLLALGCASGQSNTLACTLAVPQDVQCFYERTGFQVFGLELAAGTEIRFDFSGGEVFNLTPFTVVGWYRESYALVGEVRIPVVGDSPWLRLTTVLRW